MIELIIAGILVLVVIGLIIWFIGIYNTYFRLKNSSEATLGQIKVAMKKRLDMIEQLLGSVKSYAEFEKSTLESVTKMRSSVGSAGAGDLNQIEAESRSVLGRLFAVMENYPDLKTSNTVQDLMNSIKDIEDEIARQRYTYNNISQQFNTMLETIPSNIVGNMIHMQKLEYLEFEDENLEKAPKISF
ncbi:LemA family protein [Methanoplanus sp. FWC-SCC4]|uniref:LemA family protein n=1 Tax=Methanochimaera problematica TaxID=2609417 RepID=A0AA97FEU2_9EURY|nr:LemA family protein [Methanoplanus sp. FWC-SCC4]WOF16131.1 LemA family protein [Methanoplanus sp. FWC-SCC4]